MADTHVTVARTLPSRVIPRFLYHWLSSQPFQDYIFAALVVGATNQIELNGDRLGDAPIPVPPLPEQRRIADFLDAEIARSTVLSALLERFSKDVNERETALLARTVNAGANTVGETLPQGWRWVPLMHLTEPLRPIMYGIVLPGPNVEHGIPIIKGGDVAANRLRADQLNRTTPEIESRYVRSRLCGGDIVIAIRGSVGEIAVVPDELTDANLTQDAARISVGPGVNRAWLQAVISSPLVTSQIEARITGATIKGINIGDLKRILIPCPPTSEQQALSTRLKRDLDLHHMLRKKVEDHTKVLTERRRALLTAAVTGQIDVTTARGVQVQ
ncbi:hypothetical protein GCM10009576_058730 [Streptomyces rhizosphaericus]|uniref:Type I restriction modification DNA specificity domain-containing protein n=2 Tax=Streptomyces TaxID=1883 RepID=A0ABP4CY59_9ACTN